jgi:lysyl-tRNA synthetase class I
MVPEWMTDKNGMWTNNIINIVDILGNYVQSWLEDLEPKEVYTEMDETYKKYNEENQKNLIESYFNNLTKKAISEFESSLDQIKETITNTKNEETNG